MNRIINYKLIQYEQPSRIINDINNLYIKFEKKLNKEVSNYFGVRVNNHDNCSFSILKQNVLCLNKRIIEVAAGGSLLFATWNLFNIPLEVDFTIKLCAAIGFLSFVKIAGYQGIFYLLLISSLLQINYDIHSFDLQPTLMSFKAVSFIMGQSVVFVSGMCSLLTGLAFLIKKYGNNYTNQLLLNFNNQQNIATTGVIEIKDNLKYHFYLFGKDILCLKKIVLQLGSIVGLITSFLYETTFVEHTGGLWGILVFAAGFYSIYRLFADKIYLIPLTIGLFTAINPNSYGLYWSTAEFIISTWGQGLIFMGIYFQALSLLSNLLKGSKNKQLIQLRNSLDSLKDKQKIRKTEQLIRNQKALIEQKRDFIKQQNAQHAITEEIDALWGEQPVKKEKGNYIKKDNKKTDIDSDKSKEKDQKNTPVVPKIAIPNVAKKKYQVNLGGTNKTTWDLLFAHKKSKPEHGKIKGNDIETLIIALGGTVIPKSKSKQIFFNNNKKLGNYEVMHKGDMQHHLSSDYAERVKQAIEKAIESGYIDQNLVRVV